MELSLCMIVRDEESRLGRCLESVRDTVDEIVILDTGSADGTKAIARRYTDRVYDYAWKDDFADARNTSFSYASKPFILWLDADDVLDPGEAEKLLALKKRLDERVDAPLHEGALLSLRGRGRTRLCSIGGTTRKQRIGITIFRYE